MTGRELLEWLDWARVPGVTRLGKSFMKLHNWRRAAGLTCMGKGSRSDKPVHEPKN